MNPSTREYATRPKLVRRKLVAYRNWIEARLGTSLTETVIFDCPDNLAQVGLEEVVGIADLRRSKEPAPRRQRTFIARAEVPSDCAPSLG